MNIKEQIEVDLKQAMLARDKETVSTLRGLKSAILYVEVAEKSREQGLSEDKIVAILQKEAKKRQESADLYKQGGSPDKQQAELNEIKIIEKYLPEQMSEEELSQIISAVIQETGAQGVQAMGSTIGSVKAKVGAAADGAVIAKLVKEKLSS